MVHTPRPPSARAAAAPPLRPSAPKSPDTTAYIHVCLCAFEHGTTWV